MTHADAQFDKELAAAYEELEKAQQKLAELRRRLPHEPVSDYQLQGADGPVSLSALFGEKEDLILVHNMGSGCSYCTMWADNFNGVAHHLQDRAAFVLVSADSPSAQQEFARGRGWRFPIYSAAGSTFTAEMGFQSPGGGFMSGYQPGVSVFRKERGREHHARGQRPLRSRATPTAARGTCSICSPTAGTAGTRSSTTRRKTDHRERKGGAGPATRPLLFIPSIYTPVLWPGAGRSGKESGTSGA